MGKSRRDRERGVKHALYQLNTQLKGIVKVLEKRASAAEDKVDEGERLLAKETSQHKVCRSDAFFGARMAKVGKMARAETFGYRNTDSTMSPNGVEAVVVARGAISPPLLQGLVAEIPHSEKGWEPMQHDLSICTERGISRDNVRLEARGNQRSTKGVPCAMHVHTLTHLCSRSIKLEQVPVTTSRSIRKHRKCQSAAQDSHQRGQRGATCLTFF